jgi:pilus assembly protein CpaF
LRLRIDAEDGSTRWLELGDGTHAVGSRAGPVWLRYPTVSARHAEIRVAGGSVWFTDLGSRNGSWRPDSDGGVLKKGDLVPWKPDSVIRVGPFALSWREKGAPDSGGLRSFAEMYAALLSSAPERARDALEEKLGAAGAPRAFLDTILEEFHGDGPIARYLADPKVREILINAHDRIYVDLGEGPRLSEVSFLTPRGLEAWATRVARAAGRRLDLNNPICEATLPCGARFHAVLGPISTRGLTVAIRRFGAAPVDERGALESGWLEPRALELLRSAVREHRNVVISGGTSTGKTSLLNFLCGYLNPEERIVTIEDTVELSPPVRNLVQLQARGSNADGAGEVGLRRLVACALRLRPDRIIVGECRGAEVLEMLQAFNTGHPGSLTTVHANSPREALRRLEFLALLGGAGLTPELARGLIHSCVDLVAQLSRDETGRRAVTAIARKAGDTIEEIYARRRP